MISVKNVLENPLVNIKEQIGGFHVLEYGQDRSVGVESAMTAYYAAKMDIKKRQLFCKLDECGGVVLQPGAMQWYAGNVQATTGIKGVGDMVGKFMRAKASGEAAIKPEYTGTGVLMTEPTYKHLITLDTSEWGGAIVLDDGVFCACSTNLKHKTVVRATLSSAAFGNEGLFNLGIMGNGIVVLETNCPKEELVIVDLKDDEIRIDGGLAIAWSPSLKFTVERSTRSLIGSAASGEGLVNVYRGTGRVMMSPVE